MSVYRTKVVLCYIIVLARTLKYSIISSYLTNADKKDLYCKVAERSFKHDIPEAKYNSVNPLLELYRLLFSKYVEW